MLNLPLPMNRLRFPLRAAVVVVLALAGGAPVHAQAVPQSADEIRLTFAPLVKRTAPAVVNVFTKKTVRTAPSPLFNDPFFRRFFGDQFPGGGPTERVQNALG